MPDQSDQSDHSASAAAPDAGAPQTATPGLARETLAALWSPLLAITTIHHGRANGQIAVAGLSGSILPEAPRVLISLWKANLTHDLVRASGLFALHLLPAAPDDARANAQRLIEALGLRSGHSASDKMAAVTWTPSPITGAPILSDALRYVEARVVGTLDGAELTVFLGEVVNAGHLRAGEPLTWRDARTTLPRAWFDRYDANQRAQREAARHARGLPTNPADSGY